MDADKLPSDIILFAVNVVFNVLEYTTSLLSVSYINNVPVIKLRIGAIYRAFGATPDSEEPVALITMDEAGCDTAPALYPIAMALAPCKVEPAAVPNETAFIPP